MITKLLSAIILSISISMFSIGCANKQYYTGDVESGTRTNILAGLIDYQKDYSIDGYSENYLLDEKPTESDTYSFIRGITSHSQDRNYDLDGTKLSLLWGLITVKN